MFSFCGLAILQYCVSWNEKDVMLCAVVIALALCPVDGIKVTKMTFFLLAEVRMREVR